MFDTQNLAGIIDTYGIAAVEPEISQLVTEAHDRGVGGVAVDVLADRAQPEVARLRAFSRVVGLLAGEVLTGSDPRLTVV